MTLQLSQRTEREGPLSHHRKEGAFKSLPMQRITVEVDAACALLLTSKCLLPLKSFCE